MLVNQDAHRKLGERLARLGTGDLLGAVSPFGDDDHAFADEEVDDFLRLVETSAGVETQIEDQSFHAVGEERLHGRLELIERVAGELSDPQVCDLRILDDKIIPGVVGVALVPLDGGNHDLLAGHGDGHDLAARVAHA